MNEHLLLCMYLLARFLFCILPVQLIERAKYTLRFLLLRCYTPMQNTISSGAFISSKSRILIAKQRDLYTAFNGSETCTNQRCQLTFYLFSRLKLTSSTCVLQRRKLLSKIVLKILSLLIGI